MGELMQATTVDWSLGELNTCTAYGKLWLVARIDKHTHCARMRKRKQTFYCQGGLHKFTVMPSVQCGDLLFEDKAGIVQHLRPDGKFAEQIFNALRGV